jgi:hypothetical protein
MPFCPNCRIEYVGGATRCTDCGAELTALRPQGWSATGDPDAIRPAELCELSDQVQLDLVEALLRGAGIPSARRPRSVALFVPNAHLDRAKQVMEGGPQAAPKAAEGTVGLSELHRIRLICEECEKETTVDLLTDGLPETCACGHRFDLSTVFVVLERYGEVMRMMDKADFEIEVELPKGGDEQGRDS